VLGRWSFAAAGVTQDVQAMQFFFLPVIRKQNIG
jgi:hypothetical protein